jgi:RNA polymerase sigma-70 factor (ECF subfamily)
MVLKDEDLLVRAREQDKDALDELFNRYLDKAYAIAFNLCSGDHEQAQDITQEAFLKVLKNINRFKGKSEFSTWLYRIIYNTFLDSRKKRLKWGHIFSFWRIKKDKGGSGKEVLEELPDKNMIKNPLNVLQTKYFDQEIQKALHLLPEKQRIVFQLKVKNEMSIKEIAKITGSAPGTVKSHLFRATRALQKTLNDWKK